MYAAPLFVVNDNLQKVPRQKEVAHKAQRRNEAFHIHEYRTEYETAQYEYRNEGDNKGAAF